MIILKWETQILAPWIRTNKHVKEVQTQTAREDFPEAIVRNVTTQTPNNPKFLGMRERLISEATTRDTEVSVDWSSGLGEKAEIKTHGEDGPAKSHNGELGKDFDAATISHHPRSGHGKALLIVVGLQRRSRKIPLRLLPSSSFFVRPQNLRIKSLAGVFPVFHLP